MADSTQIKMYPELDKEGAFNLSPEISEKMKEIYQLIDDLPMDMDTADIILDEYNSGYLKAVEELLTTPMGKFEEVVFRMLTEIHNNMQVNYDAHMGDEGGNESVDTSRKPDPIVFERVMTEINAPNKQYNAEDEDISDEEMLKILPDR